MVPMLVREVDARYPGQSYELTVTLAPEDPPSRLATRFHALHRERYDYAEPDSAVEVIALRSVGLVPPETPLPVEEVPLLEPLADASVVVDGRSVRCPVLRVAQDAARPATRPAGPAIAGPALVTAAEFSAFVAPGWLLSPLPGALNLSREGGVAL